jgi:hypothetical protein
VRRQKVLLSSCDRFLPFGAVFAYGSEVATIPFFAALFYSQTIPFSTWQGPMVWYVLSSRPSDSVASSAPFCGIAIIFAFGICISERFSTKCTVQVSNSTIVASVGKVFKNPIYRPSLPLQNNEEGFF